MSVHEPEVLDVDLDGPEQSRRPIVAGIAAGLWSLLVGVALVTCLVMLAWAVSPNSAGDSAAAWRAAGSVWLGAHQVPLELGGRELTLLPLGALLLGLLLTRRSGRWAGRLLSGTTPGEAVGIVVSCAVVYGAGGAGVAWLSSGPGTGASPPSAFLWTGIVALAGATWGIAAEAELVALLRSHITDAAWRTVVGGLAAVVGLFAVGAALVTVSLLRHVGQIATTMADLSPGPVGGLALTVLGALCLPTLDVWGLAVVVGPGVDLGSAGGLSAFGGQVESLPALPVLAAIPTTIPAWGPALLLVPVALGVLAARIRWGRDLPTLTGAAISGAGLAGVVAALVGGLVLLASGSLGGGRLADVGPQPVPVAASAAGLVLLGFVAEAAFQSLRLSWQLHQAEQRAQSRRLRMAARGLADAVDGPDLEAPEGEVAENQAADELAVAVAEAVAEAADAVDDESSPVAVVSAGDAGSELDQKASTAPVRRFRAPRPMRDAVVIPVVAAPGAAPVVDFTQEAPAVEPDRDFPTAPAIVDLTQEAPAEEPDVTPTAPTDATAPASGEDGDSTVDLPVDLTDLEAIRDAARVAIAGEGIAGESLPVDPD